MGVISGLKRSVVKTVEGLLKKSSGLEFPDKEETLGFLKSNLISGADESHITLPEVRNIADENLVIFPETLVNASRDYTWKIEDFNESASTMRIGSIAIGKKVLHTDFGYVNLLTGDYGTREVIRDFLVSDKRPVLTVDTLIAPWTHYFRKEYFMYVLFIAAKICRIKEKIPEHVFDDSVVSYPLFNTAFEKEYLELLGIKSTKVVDSRSTKIVFKECYLANNDNWMHPNISDVMSLKRQMEPKLRAAARIEKQNNRVYISRSGRRRVLNEADLVKMLLKYDFKIYEDKPRSVAEQYEIYHNASFIIGPHGSSFANVVWCRPGTHLFELFPPRYVYNFFNYLAFILDLKYSAYSSGPVSYEFNSKAVNDDILVSIPDIEDYLKRIFSGNTNEIFHSH